MNNLTITINRNDLIKCNGAIVPPSLGVTELSATQQKLLNEYLVEIIVNSIKGLTNEKS